MALYPREHVPGVCRRWPRYAPGVCWCCASPAPVRPRVAWLTGQTRPWCRDCEKQLGHTLCLPPRVEEAADFFPPTDLTAAPAAG